MTIPEASHNEEQESLDDRWHALDFSVRRSTRYHLRRRRFFETWHRIVVVTSLFGGSAAFAAIVSNSYENVGMVAAALVAAFNSIDLVMGFARRAWEHSDLASQFLTLEQEMLDTRKTETNYRALYKKRLAIERNEPPILRLVDLQSHNELVLAEGYPDLELYNLKWYHKLIAPFGNFFVDSVKLNVPPNDAD